MYRFAYTNERIRKGYKRGSCTIQPTQRPSVKKKIKKKSLRAFVPTRVAAFRQLLPSTNVLLEKAEMNGPIHRSRRAPSPKGFEKSRNSIPQRTGRRTLANIGRGHTPCKPRPGSGHPSGGREKRELDHHTCPPQIWQLPREPPRVVPPTQSLLHRRRRNLEL